jgi:recombining binding protein (suppressor of hairless)
MDIILKSSLTGLTSTTMVVKKVDKSEIVKNCDEPVSQLHKVAFQIKDVDGQYLALVEDSITTQKSSANSSIGEAASWTIVGTGLTFFPFFILLFSFFLFLLFFFFFFYFFFFILFKFEFK